MVEFFGDYQKGEVVGCDDDSDVSAVPVDDDFPADSEGQSSTQVTTTPAELAPYNPVNIAKHSDAALSSHITSPSPTASPFPFLNLPPSIRHKIYSYLLVIPALICVRQNHTVFHPERLAFLYTEPRSLLPGIAYALAQTTVSGLKTRLAKFPGTNINILRVSREVFIEARAVMYRANNFEIVKPTNELSPQPDFSVRLFPPGYQRLVAKLNIRIRTFYNLDWLLRGGYNVLKNYYRGLQTLTLILEIDSAGKGFGREWAKHAHEKWTVYIQRLRGIVAVDMFGGRSKVTNIPTWIDLRVLFAEEAYDDTFFHNAAPPSENDALERKRREVLRSGLVETWELFKRGGK